jgi:predicted TIM-barrel fold metal-dependent hydrolase
VSRLCAAESVSRADSANHAPSGRRNLFLTRSAKYPNVSVKLSSAPTYSFEPYPWRDMTEHLKRCFDAFGPQRCYWGTDITNAFTKSTYRQRITHFTEELDFLSKEDKG